MRQACFLLLGCLLLAPGVSRAAADYTDIWYNPNESGWGVNIVQSDDGTAKPFLFATFFIYGPDKRPTWYTGQLTWVAGAGRFEGNLYATRGTYFTQPWNPADLSVQAAGTVTFTPTSAYTGTLVYTVTGLPQVTRTIQRQTLTRIALAASYIGGQTGTYTNCGTSNGNYSVAFTLTVTQTTTNAQLDFNYGNDFTCRLSGPIQQYGQLFEMPGASYQCTRSGAVTFSTTATVSAIKQTAQGIEGRWSAGPFPAGGTCLEEARFSAAY